MLIKYDANRHANERKEMKRKVDPTVPSFFYGMAGMSFNFLEPACH